MNDIKTTLASGNSYRVNSELVSKDGKVIEVDLSAQKIQIDGKRALLFNST